MALKLKTRTMFPAVVTAASPLTLVKTGLAYAFGLDVTALLAMLRPSLALTDREVNAAGAVTIIATDELVRINKTVSQATPVNLPPSSSYTKDQLIIKDQKGDATAYPISVTPNGTQTIDGQTGARLIDWPYGGLRLRPISGGWLTLP